MSQVTLFRSICPFCGVGCGFYLVVANGQVKGINKWLDHEVCKGILCPKGTFSWKLIHHPERLKRPVMRKGGKLVEVSWKEAIGEIASRLKKLKQDDPRKAYFIASAKITNEEAYMYQKFVRVVMGTNNVDHCVRLCHAATLEGLSSVFGKGAMTNPMNDIENAKTIISVGYNFGDSHPVIFRHVLAAKRKGSKVIVVDPRKNSAAKHADIHVRIRPGTDLVFLAAIINYILANEMWDKKMEPLLDNMDGLRKSVSSYTPKVAEELTGISRFEIMKISEMIAREKPVTFLYGMGITQKENGTESVKAIAALAAITGNIGRPGGGVGPARGQNNVQGACDMGCIPDRLPGYVLVNSKRAQEIGAIWGAKIDPVPGMYSSQVFPSAARGKLDYIHIIGENPVLSEPDTEIVIKGIENSFVVVQDIFLTETAELADIVLPAALWAEKKGSFTNTERRVQLTLKAVNPPGAAIPDLEIISRIAREMGYNWAADPSLVFEEIRRVIPFMRGISHSRLERERNGIVWPCPDENSSGERILYRNRFSTPNGKAHLPDLRVSVALADTSTEYPFVLINGRLLMQYNSGAMSRRIRNLLARFPRGFVEINPNDAAKLGIEDGDVVKVVSRWGELSTKVIVTENVPAGVVFVPNHYADTPVNRLVQGIVDPSSGEPRLKGIAVRIERMSQ